MSGWKSRWSWLRLVNAATAKRTPSARRSSSAWEETSIAHAAVARVEHRAERRLQVDRLRRRAHGGPLLPADDRRHAARAARTAARRPPAAARTRYVVVVLPLVPVIPTTASSAVGSPWKSRRRARHRGPHVVDEHLRHAEPERALDDQRRRAARHRVGGEVVAVAGEAGHAEEQRPRADRAVVVGEGDDVNVGPVAEQFAQRHARETLAMASVPIELRRRTAASRTGSPRLPSCSAGCAAARRAHRVRRAGALLVRPVRRPRRRRPPGRPRARARRRRADRPACWPTPPTC